MRGGIVRALLVLCLTLVMAPALPASVAVADPATTGTVDVVVLDGGAPVPKAVVLLTGGHSGTTDANGRLSFSGLAFGQYRAMVATAQLKGGDGTVTIDQAHPTGTITVAVSSAWPEPAAGIKVPSTCGACTAPTLPTPPSCGACSAPTLPTPPACGACQAPSPPTPPSCGACQPPHPATGSLTGRVCAPASPGAAVSATGPNGQTAAAWVAADSGSGLYRSYSLSNLAPGLWKLVLTVGGKAVASVETTVKAGETASAPDFSLACTGSGGSPSAAYLGGGALILAGIGIIGWRRVRRV